VKDTAGTVTNQPLPEGAEHALTRRLAEGLREVRRRRDGVWPSVDGTHLANMRSAMLSDGRNLFGGQNDGGPPPKSTLRPEPQKP
jgi:hypothetical protein